MSLFFTACVKKRNKLLYKSSWYLETTNSRDDGITLNNDRGKKQEYRHGVGPRIQHQILQLFSSQTPLSWRETFYSENVTWSYAKSWALMYSAIYVLKCLKRTCCILRTWSKTWKLAACLCIMPTRVPKMSLRGQPLRYSSSNWVSNWY